ncbi:MAG TPA: histidine kinase [Bacillota bacterium]
MQNIYSRFFIKNFLVFLIPLLIPLLILGAISTVAVRDFLKNEINKNNQNLLKLTQNNLELIFDEMDSLYLNFSTTPEISIKLKKILSNPYSGLAFDELDTIKTIQIFLDTPANAHPYIHSIYVYFNNPNQKMITTTEGLTDLRAYYDTSWYDSYVQNGRNLSLWTEPRIISQYAFEKKPTQVETIYRRLYTSGNPNAGVIVLNIKTEYIEHLLDNLETLPDQGFMIVDENNRVIFRNRQAHSIGNDSLMKIINHPSNNFVYHSQQGDFTVSYLLSPKYHWKYISVVPQQTLYAIPLKLQKFILLLLPGLFVLGLVLTYWLARNNYLRIQNIISIIEAAKTNSTLPGLPAQINDEYGFITYNLLTTFIEQNYLKLQLSERKYKLQVMELLALQAQINPHFLFNTLDTIKWQIIGLAKKPNETSAMIEQLSEILKYSLEQPNKTVSLKEEIQNTRNYINILKILYRDKFDLIWDYDENVLDCQVIRLLFQPLIENSIYHGIKEKSGQSYLKIKIQLQGGLLKIAVIDNGLGIRAEKLKEIRTHLDDGTEGKGHIGLVNTKKRLELTFGEGTLFKVNSKLNLGTVITIRIPCPLNQEDIS